MLAQSKLQLVTKTISFEDLWQRTSQQAKSLHLSHIPSVAWQGLYFSAHSDCLLSDVSDEQGGWCDWKEVRCRMQPGSVLSWGMPLECKAVEEVVTSLPS